MIDQLRNDLIFWGNKNFRKYEWRINRTPYTVLISEIMLHRTNAKQVVPVYHKFMTEYPYIGDLEKAKLQDIKESLKSLGLYWRAQKLYEMSKIIAQKYNCNIPDNMNNLVSLPGISNYIAGAIMCFGYLQPIAIIDTNIVRIIGRLFNIEVTDSLRRNKNFKSVVELILDQKHPVEFNYALLDLGAIICTVKSPNCGICPVLYYCKYGQTLTMK